MTTPILETERLILAPLVLADAPAIQRLFPQWEVVRHLSNKVPWPYPEDGAMRHLEDMVLPAMATGRHFHWGLRLKGCSDALIGIISLRPYDPGDDQRGFWLDPAHQGRGLMSEAAERVTQFAFVDLGIASITVGNAVENGASGRIKQKQGATLIRTEPFDFVAGRLMKEVWRIDRDAWLARQGG